MAIFRALLRNLLARSFLASSACFCFGVLRVRFSADDDADPGSRTLLTDSSALGLAAQVEDCAVVLSVAMDGGLNDDEFPDKSDGSFIVDGAAAHAAAAWASVKAGTATTSGGGIVASVFFFFSASRWILL